MTVTPQRIQRKRTKGWRMPENTVYVGRPTIYGNPFAASHAKDAVDAFRKHCQPGTKTIYMAANVLWLAKDRHPNSLHFAYAEWLATEGLANLRGKDLACWCPLDQPCHADVLLELANPTERTTP
jgi:hypothetical protein